MIQNFNVDSLRKVIVDSIGAAQKQQGNSIDYVSKLDGFYNSAWTKLTVLFALIGVLIPAIITFIQMKKNEADKRVLMALIKDEIRKEMEKQKEETEKYLEREVTKIQHASQGVSYHIQSEIFYDKNMFKESFAETVNAMTLYMVGEDYTNFMNALDDLQKRFAKISKKDIKSIKDSYNEYYHIDALIKKMEETDDQTYICHVGKLKEALGALV